MRVETRAVALPSLDTVKMEDRKRPSGAEDSQPPAKRHQVAVNGSKAHVEDFPWKDDIEVRSPLRPSACAPAAATAPSNRLDAQAYQKDAILRQMKEFKREKNAVEAELRDIEKKSRYHDDHLRAIDLWFEQVSTLCLSDMYIDADQA